MDSIAKAFASFGVSAKEAEEALLKLAQLIKEFDDYSKVNDNEESSSDIRSALDAKTENPNQKGDLEIFSQIVWDEDFLKMNASNPFLN